MHQPGQYLSVKVSIPELNLYQPRQYNISSAPDGHYYRISVKKEAGTPDKEDGRVSNYLHNVLQEGDVLVASSPAGDFVLNTTQRSPLVLLSGGAGKDSICILASDCGLKSILDGGLEALYLYLNRYTLDDISKPAVSKPYPLL